MLESTQVVHLWLILPPLLVHSSLREDYCHRQSAEAGARKGLNAGVAACVEFARSFLEEKTLLEPTLNSYSLFTHNYAEEEKNKRHGVKTENKKRRHKCRNRD